jgi:hypothetical protein
MIGSEMVVVIGEEVIVIVTDPRLLLRSHSGKIKITCRSFNVHTRSPAGS